MQQYIKILFHIYMKTATTDNAITH